MQLNFLISFISLTSYKPGISIQKQETKAEHKTSRHKQRPLESSGYGNRHLPAKKKQECQFHINIFLVSLMSPIPCLFPMQMSSPLLKSFINV